MSEKWTFTTFILVAILSSAAIAEHPYHTIELTLDKSRLVAFDMDGMLGGGMLLDDDDAGLNSSVNAAIGAIDLFQRSRLEEFDEARNAFFSARQNYDWFAAENAGRKARTAAEEKNEPLDLALADSLLGTALAKQGNFTAAQPILERAKKVFEKTLGSDHLYSIWLHARLTEIAYFKGQLNTCIKLGKQLPEYAQGDFKKDELLSALLDARYWSTRAAIELGQFSTAEPVITASLKQTANSNFDNLKRAHSRALELQSLLLRNQGKPIAAIKAAEQSLKIRQTTNPGTQFEIDGLIFLAELLFDQKKLQQLNVIIQQATQVAQNNSRLSEWSLARLHLKKAFVSNDTQLDDQTKAALSKALDFFRRSNSRKEVVIAAKLLADDAVSRGQITQAITLYREALDNIDSMFAATQGMAEQTRKYFLGQYLNYYTDIATYLTDQYLKSKNALYGKKALEVVSRTQSRIFTELLRQAMASDEKNDVEFNRLIKQREAARKTLDQLREEFFRLPNTDNDELLAIRIGSLKRGILTQQKSTQLSLDKINAVLWQKYPRFMELSEPKPVTVSNLQKQHLQTNEKIVTYLLQPERVNIFVTGKNHFSVHVSSQNPGEVTDKITRIRQFMNEGLSIPPGDLHRLYRLLLQPLEGTLKATDRVIIVGDGPLHALPLGMLVSNWSQQDQQRYQEDINAGKDAYAHLSYAADNWNFNYMPSLAAFTALREYKAKTGSYRHELVSFADPVFSKSSSSDSFGFGSSEAESNDIGLSRLQETAEEAQAIANITGGKSKIFLREKAQEILAKQLKNSDARYLHFATHGLLGSEYLLLNTQDSTQPETIQAQPSLVLSLSGNMQNEDGFLTMSDVINDVQTNAELVVLSACNTAGEGGNPGGGEGFAGMTRAFMFAGAGGLYVSHWAVESLATRDLMIEAFKQLKAGNKPGKALSIAQTKVRNSAGRGNPWFWAPFVYVGL